MLFDHRPEHLPRHRPLARGDEDGVDDAAREEHGPRVAGVTLEPVLRLLADRHQAILAALAGHPQHALTQIDLIDREVDQLGHAQAGRVKQFEHRPVAQAERRVHVGRADQRLDLPLAQRLRQRLGEFRRVEQQGRIDLDRAQALLHPVEMAQRRQQARVAARGITALAAFGQITMQLLARAAQQRRALACAPARETFQIAPVAGERIFRQPRFGPGAFEKVLDQQALVLADAVADAQRRRRGLFCRFLHVRVEDKLILFVIPHSRNDEPGTLR